jgi:hypothetical protein
MDVHYRNEDGIQECNILTVHHENLLEPYYTVGLQEGNENQSDKTHITLRLQDGKRCDKEGMSHQDVARQQCAQHYFILQKQKMKKGKWTATKNIGRTFLPRRKPKFWRMMLRHTKNTGSSSFLKRKPKSRRMMLQHTKMLGVLPSPRESPNLER